MGNLLADASSQIGQNIGIVFCKTSRQYYPPFVSKDIIAHRLFSAMCEITYIAPLYIKNDNGLFSDDWCANIDSDSYRRLTKNISLWKFFV